MAISSTISGVLHASLAWISPAAPASGTAEAAAAATAIFLVLGGGLALMRRRQGTHASAKPGPLPPCPPGKWPIFGHLPLLAGVDRPDHLFHRLAEELGPVFHLQLGRVTSIVICSEELARESLIKKGRTYAGRWSGKVLMQYSDQGKDLSLAPYGENWRKMRRVVHKILTPLALDSMDCRLEIESIRMIQHIFEGMDHQGHADPRLYCGEGLKVQPLFSAFACNMVLSKALGMTFDRLDDQLFKTICHAIDVLFEASGPGAVEDYFPGGLIEKIVMYRKNRTVLPILVHYRQEFMAKTLRDIKLNLDKEVAAGLDPLARDHSYAEELLLNMEKDQLEFDYIVGFLLDFLTAGIDTTAATLHWTVLYLINHQDIQTRMIDEIDSVTHGTRLPTLSDMNAMPLLRAVIKEMTRLVPVAQLGLPRMTIEEDCNLGGYYVPAGAQVIYNIHAIHRSMYAEPDRFDPDRWLPQTGGKDAPTDTSDRTANSSWGKSPSGRSLDILDGNYAFGQGRRLCPGVHLAYREMFLALSGILTFFRIESGDGNCSLPTEGTFGLTTLPIKQVSARFVDRGSPLRSELAKQRGDLEARLQTRGKKASDVSIGVPAAAAA